MATQTISKQTQKNWWIDAALFTSAIAAALSGIYFLFLPSGGYQGGRNPFYNVTILFSRSTWDDLHTWGGVAMIAAAIIHLAIHWPWVVSMARRTWKGLTGKGGGMNARRALEPDPEFTGSGQLYPDSLQWSVFLVRPRRALGSRPGLALLPHYLGSDPYLGGGDFNRCRADSLRHPLEVGHQGDEENGSASASQARAPAASAGDGPLRHSR